MNFTTYRVHDAFGGVEILELTEVDVPVLDLLKKQLVDLEALRTHLAQDLQREEVPAKPYQVNPLLPVTFRYRRDSMESPRKIRGLVTSNDQRALMQFARQHLVSVEENDQLDAWLNRSRSIEDEELRTETRPIHEYLLVPHHTGNRSAPLFLYGETKSSDFPQRNASLFIRANRTNQDLVFFDNRIIQTSNRIKYGRKIGANYEESYGSQDYTPAFVVGEPLDVRTNRDGNVPETWNMVFDQSPMRNNQKYWSYRGRRGTVEEVEDIPVELIRQLEERGRQIHFPNTYCVPVSRTFLRPRILLGGNRFEIEQKLTGIEETPDSISAIEGNLENGYSSDLLQTPGGLYDLRQPLNLNGYWPNRENTELEYETVEPGTGKEKNEKSTSSCLPWIRNEELTAGVLARTQNHLYMPDRMPSSFRFMEPAGDELWYALCDVSRGGAFHGSR